MGEGAPNRGNDKAIKAAWDWGNRMKHNLAWLEPWLDLGIQGALALDGSWGHTRNHLAPILKRGKWDREGKRLTQWASRLRLSFFVRSFTTPSNPVGPLPVTQLLLFPPLGRAPFCSQQPLRLLILRSFLLKPPDTQGDCHHVGLSFLC